MTFLKIERIPLKILIPVVAVVTIVALAYSLIILFDPYYVKCDYDGISTVKCWDNNAAKVQDWFAAKIHSIVPYAVAQMTTLPPQIPLQDAPYPNENHSNPLVMALTKDAHQFMIHAYQAQLNNDSQAYNTDVWLNNAIVCYHGLVNNNTALLSSCDSTMVTVKMYFGQYNTTPHWFITLVNDYLKARGIEQ